MLRPPSKTTRADTRFPCPELFRSAWCVLGVACWHEVVLAAELLRPARFNFGEDARAVGVVDDAQVDLVGRHDCEARGAIAVRGVAGSTHPKPDGDTRTSIAHEDDGGQHGPQQQPAQAAITQPLVALYQRLAAATDVGVRPRVRDAARTVCAAVVHPF